jgi:hypothetical protein
MNSSSPWSQEHLLKYDATFCVEMWGQRNKKKKNEEPKRNHWIKFGSNDLW